MILEKIKKNGLMGSLKIFIKKINNLINKYLYYFFCLFPINNDLLLLESEGDLSDNSYALYEHMNEAGLLEKYKVVWFVDDVKKAKKKIFKNTDCVKKFPTSIQIKRSYYLATCRWNIYDHCNLIAELKKRKNQTLVYLSHGWGYKAAKGSYNSKILTHPDYITSTGMLSAKGLAEYWEEPINKVIITGYPRIDYFYKENKYALKIANEIWKFNKYKKVIFWMPTFRQSINSLISENYINNETGLPLFETNNSLIKFSEFLKEKDILLVFKIHHLQAELKIFKEKIDNIVIIHDYDLYLKNIQLYQIINFADVIISDYSSISIDFLPLNRPIIYTLDDYDKYNNSRGLFPQNAIDYMPGYHVYTIQELKESICEIMNGIDNFKSKREQMRKLYHKYLDENSSARILKFLGFKN